MKKQYTYVNERSVCLVNNKICFRKGDKNE
mgnify:CR=1 FL=1|jgi:hypothetical protein